MVTLAAMCNVSFMVAAEPQPVAKACCTNECCLAAWKKIEQWLIIGIDIAAPIVNPLIAEEARKSLAKLKTDNPGAFAALVAVCQNPATDKIVDSVYQKALADLNLVDSSGTVSPLIKALVKLLVPDITTIVTDTTTDNDTPVKKGVTKSGKEKEKLGSNSEVKDLAKALRACSVAEEPSKQQRSFLKKVGKRMEIAEVEDCITQGKITQVYGYWKKIKVLKNGHKIEVKRFVRVDLD